MADRPSQIVGDGLLLDRRGAAMLASALRLAARAAERNGVDYRGRGLLVGVTMQREPDALQPDDEHELHAAARTTTTRSRATGQPPSGRAGTGTSSQVQGGQAVGPLLDPGGWPTTPAACRTPAGTARCRSRTCARSGDRRPPPGPSAGPPRPAGELSGALRQVLDAFDEPAARAVLDRLMSDLSLTAVLRDVVMPYLTELGERWERGTASVAQEHFASNLIRGRLAGLARGWGNGHGPRAVLACPPGSCTTWR